MNLVSYFKRITEIQRSLANNDKCSLNGSHPSALIVGETIMIKLLYARCYSNSNFELNLSLSILPSDLLDHMDEQ